MSRHGLGQINKQALLDRRPQLHSHRLAAEVLEQFKEEFEKPILELVTSASSSVKSRSAAEEFVAKPSLAIPHLEWLPVGVREQVQRAFNVPQQFGTTKNMVAALASVYCWSTWIAIGT